MKKVLKLSAAAAVALSAITPVAAFAAETEATQVKPGIYTTDATKGFTSIDEFKKLSLKEKAALLQVKDAVLVLGTEAIPASVILTGTNDDLANSRVSVEKYQEDNNVILDSEVGIKPGEVTSEVKVTAVSAITTTTVDVTFEAATADIIGATVEVKDADGTVYAVKAIDISEGDTAASFDFVTAVDEKALTGVWTVDGKEFNFDVISQLEAILDAASKADQVALLNALATAGIENVNEDLIAEYATAIVDADPTVETLADVQATINKANEDNVSADAKAKALLAVKDANTEVALLKALQQFKYVNADWAKDYASGKAATVAGNDSVAGFEIDPDAGSADYNKIVKTNGTSEALSAAGVFSYDDVQTVINAVNERKVSAAWDTAWNSAKSEDLAKAKTLIETYIPADTDAQAKVKAYYLDEVAILDAVIKVNSASTNNSFKNALVALDTLENALNEKYAGTDYAGEFTNKLNLDDVKDSLLAQYREALKDITAGDDKNQASDIKNVIDAVNANNANDLLTAVTTAATKEDLAKALKAYGVVQVADTNLNAYFTYDADTDGAADYKGVATVEEAQTLVDTVNLSEVANATASTIIEKLNVFGLDNLVVANAAKYEADKATIGASANLGATNKVTVANVKADVANSNATVAEAGLIKSINLAKSATEVKAALDELAIASYVDVPNADKLFIAEQVFAAVENTNSPSATSPYADLDAIEDALNTATTGIIDVYEALVAKFGKNVTSTSTLVSNFGELGYEPFDALTNAQKATVAQTFVANYPTDNDGAKVDYTTLAAVKAALDTIIAGL